MERNYKRTVLFSTDAFEVVSCEWSEGSVSLMHDHLGSACSVWVQEGQFEDKTVCGFHTETKVVEAGTVYNTPIGAHHEIRCLSATGKTMHVYTPKIPQDKKADHWTVNPQDLKSLSLQLNDQGVSTSELETLLNSIEAAALPTASPYFMNQLFSGIFPQTLLAQDVINRTRTTLATAEASPVFSEIEKRVVTELGRVIGWDTSCVEGITVAGGSAANLMALHCARYKMWPESKQRGLVGVRPRLYVSVEAHYSFQKGAAALGFGTDAVIGVSVDSFNRMDARALDAQIARDIENGYHPFFIGATAGTTVFGAFDPFEELAVIARKYNLWLHADAAWGAPALFSKTAAHLVHGIALVDSVTFDAHKFFGSNLTNSFFLTKHPQILFLANDVKGGEYLFHDTQDLDRGRLSWQCGRGAEVLSFWTLWKHLGHSGMTAAIDRLLQVTRDTVEWIKTEERLQLVGEAPFLNICVEVLPKSGIAHPEWSKIVRDTLKRNNQVMVNYSSQNGRTFLRLIVVHPEISVQHLKNILNCARDIDETAVESSIR